MAGQPSLYNDGGFQWEGVGKNLKRYNNDKPKHFTDYFIINPAIAIYIYIYIYIYV